MLIRRITYPAHLLVAVACTGGADATSDSMDPTVEGPLSDGEAAGVIDGQSGGEGAARYDCLCQAMEERVATSATVLATDGVNATLHVDEVLGRHVIEPDVLEGQVLTASIATSCEASERPALGSEVLAFYRPGLIAGQTGACYDDFTTCSSACDALTAPSDDAPKRCVTACSLTADLRCSSDGYDAGGPDDEWVIIPWDDPRVAGIEDRDALGIGQDDLQGPTTGCNEALAAVELSRP